MEQGVLDYGKREQRSLPETLQELTDPSDSRYQTAMDLTDTWAERILEFTPRGSTASRRLFVRLGRPHTEPGMAGSWRVEIEIQEGMDEPIQSHSTGVDSFHALELAVRHISIVMDGWEECGEVRWCGEQGSGFYAPKPR